MDWILPNRLAIGNYLDAVEAERSGFASVLSLTNEHAPIHPGTTTCALVDGSNAPSSIAHAIRELNRLLQNACPVLVHCHAGVSRSPAIVAGYLAVYEGMALNEAFLFIDARQKIQLSPGLLPALKRALALLGPSAM